MTFKTFGVGDVLTAADANDFMRQSVIPVADYTAAEAVRAVASNAVVKRADARGLHQLEYHGHLGQWLPVSGVLSYPNLNAANMWATAIADMLTVGDVAMIGGVRHVWTGTTTYWKPERSLFLARGGNAQATAAGWNVLAAAFTAPAVNDFGNWSAGALTIDRAGFYRLSAAVRITGASNPLALQITRNSTVPDGATCLAAANISASSFAIGVDTIAPLAAGDVIRVLAFTNAANNLDATLTGAQLSVELIRAT